MLVKPWLRIFLPALFTCLGMTPSGCQAAANEFYCTKRVVGYYPDYHAWRLPVHEIPFESLTHIVYFSLAPEADGGLDETQINEVHQSDLTAAAHSHEIKVLICVGGWGLSQHFSAVAAHPETRQAFIANITEYCRTYGFDGVDLDWEPILTETDRANYLQLVTELKTALSTYGLTLSVAVMALGQELNAAAVDDVDWLNVMAYDMGTPHSAYDDAVTALAHWEGRGFYKNQIVLGVPFYGRGEDGSYMLYRDIVAAYQPEADVDEVAGINFNSPATIGQKTTFVVENDFGGIAIWELAGDTLDNSSLLLSISNTLLREIPPDFNCDHLVDMHDLLHFAALWLAEPCNTTNTWCAACDKDQSGRVDLKDLMEINLQWLLNL